MRSLDPKQHVRFLAQHFDLVDDIYEAPDGYTEAELFSPVRSLSHENRIAIVNRVVELLEPYGKGWNKRRCS